MKFNRKQVIIRILALIIIAALGLWSFYNTSVTSGLSVLILCFFSFITGFILILYWLFRKELKKRIMIILAIILIIIALILGLVFGQKQLHLNAEHIKKETVPMMQALQNYCKVHGTYPDTLEELGILVPKPRLGDGKFNYHAYKDNDNKPHFSLYIRLGSFQKYIWNDSLQDWIFYD